MIARLKKIINNEISRSKWIEKSLKILPHGKILDLGCGSQQYRKFCDHLIYRGQDFGKSTYGFGTEKLEYKYGKLDYIGNCWEVNEADEFFDYILCTEVLEHIPYPVKTLEEINRLLKLDGFLILTVPSHSLRHFEPYWFLPGFSDNWLNKHLPENGFNIEELNPIGNYYSWIFVELVRSIKLHKMAILFNIPAIVYYYLKSRKPTDEDVKLLTMGYHVIARKVSSLSK